VFFFLLAADELCKRTAVAIVFLYSTARETAGEVVVDIGGCMGG
jgi:hypothetical protein